METRVEIMTKQQLNMNEERRDWKCVSVVTSQPEITI